MKDILNWLVNKGLIRREHISEHKGNITFSEVRKMDLRSTINSLSLKNYFTSIRIDGTGYNKYAKDPSKDINDLEYFYIERPLPTETGMHGNKAKIYNNTQMTYKREEFKFPFFGGVLRNTWIPEKGKSFVDYSFA